MRIGILINDVTAVGGVERVVTNTANKFHSILGHEVEIISVFTNKNDRPSFNIDEGVQIKYINRNITTNKENKFSKYSSIIKKIHQIIEDRKYDLVLCNSISLVLIALIIKKFAVPRKVSFKIVAWEHSQFDNVSEKFKQLRNIIYRFIDGVVTLTEQDKALFNKINSNTRCIYNMNPFISTTRANLNAKKVIAVGRLEEEKGFDMLIEAFSIVNKEYPDWVLNIYGEGSQRDFLERNINDKNLQNYIKLNNFTNNIIDNYVESSIFVLSSRTESFGMVLVEAMSNGLACISFDCKVGPREIIKNNTDGLLVEPNNIEELASKIINLINDSKLRNSLAENAMLKAKLFSTETIMSEWDYFLSEMK
ncbi:glycosyltransferase family 4 protein [Halalkalibacter okhensis]|uniref:Glycosyl transferase family 1 domain-containing protein n=1 Tax=Halalkalibacter okhensis TaxID=333138 RepID=A0A0B0IDX5_9BACI|nr:glycosyltransferase family 4 protein [Halalkalibacter okhensis]KHF38264.1 hypothetical protein LQ50_22310 [Halalkalibacter okhensis]